jgi:hypothetical protein
VTPSALNVAYGTKSGCGSRTIANGALEGVHFVKTFEYVQVTFVGDFTKINSPGGGSGGVAYFLLLYFLDAIFQTVIDGYFLFHRQGQPK